MPRQISRERKTAYYIGMGIMVLGGILFASAFFVVAMNFGNFSKFESLGKTFMFLAFGGFALLVLGGVIQGIGAKGLAGSGVVFNPKKAREDLEPYSRMAGGMVKDALEEADISIGSRAEKIVMIKCTSCRKLNEEDAKFCKECGKEI